MRVSIGSDGTLAFQGSEWFVRTPGGLTTNTGLAGYAAPSGSGALPARDVAVEGVGGPGEKPSVVDVRLRRP